MCVRACPFVSSLSLSPYPSTFVYSTRDISSQLLCTTRLSSLEASSVHPCVYIRYTLPLSLSWHTRARGNPRRETDRSAGARASRARTYVGGKGGGRLEGSLLIHRAADAAAAAARPRKPRVRLRALCALNPVRIEGIIGLDDHHDGNGMGWWREEEVIRRARAKLRVNV